MQFRLTPAQFAKKQAEVEAEVGHPIDGTSGLIVYKGVTVQYVFSDPNLTVEVVSKPRAMPGFVIDSKIKGWFEGV